MKKIIIVFLIIFIVGCNKTAQENNGKVLSEYEKLLDSVQETAFIDSFTIYGRYFNLTGYLEKDVSNLSLVLKNEDIEEEYELILENTDSKTSFQTTELINQGINLEKITSGNYIIFLKEITDDKTSYYTLENATNYTNLDYYTITKDDKNQKIDIAFDKINDKNFLYLKANVEKLPEDIYDIVIDPGHGGIDVGANKNGYFESNINLEYALLLEEKLTDLGLKVKLTRQIDESIDNYGSEGRVSVPYETKAKLMLSIHMNSSLYNVGAGGVEIYVPNHADITFAKNLAEEIVASTSTNYSANVSNKISSGVYLRTLSMADLEDIRESALEEGYEPYEKATLDSTYYYIIRETGGIVTSAYVDSRNKEKEWNHYYASNHGCEAYLLELGYMNSSSNLDILLTEKDEYVNAIVSSVREYLEI